MRMNRNTIELTTKFSGAIRIKEENKEDVIKINFYCLKTWNLISTYSRMFS